MRTLVTAVCVAAALSALPLQDSVRPPREVSQLQGSGFWQTLGCGACVGSMAFSYTMGYGSVWSALMGAGDGALADACISACFE